MTVQDDLDAALGPPATADLLVALEVLLRRFVILPSPACYLALSLFVAHTWAFDAAHATPYLVIESPEKQAGKTRLLEVLELVCRNPLKVVSITPAALFQSVAADRPTLLIDEGDAMFAVRGERNEELRGLLNAGNRPGSKAIRGGRNGEPLCYDVCCPMVIAGIATGRLPDTIRDRAIVVPIDRKLRSETVERFRAHLLQAELDDLRGELQRWAEEHFLFLHSYYPAPFEQISDRLDEAWEPLFAIAELAGGAYPATAKAAAQDLAGEGDDDATASHALLVALRGVFGDEDKLSSAAIVAALIARDELPFGGWNDGSGITQSELARRLKPYRIRPRKVRIGTTTLQGYARDWFEAAWERYGGDAAARTSGTAQHPPGSSMTGDPEHDRACSGSPSRENGCPARVVPGVPDESGGPPTDDATPDGTADELPRHADLPEPRA